MNDKEIDALIAQRIVDTLNRMLEADPIATRLLCCPLVQVNSTLADDPYIQVQGPWTTKAGDGSVGFAVSLTGIVNGMCHDHRIFVEWTDPDEHEDLYIVGFGFKDNEAFEINLEMVDE